MKDPRLIVSPLCAALCSLIGLLLLLLWPNIQSAVAAGFILAGLALWLAWRERSNWEKAARLISKLGLLGLGTVQLFHYRPPGQMPRLIAVGFIFVAISLLVHYLTNHRNHALSRSLSYVVFGLAWSAAIGHVFGTPLFSITTGGHAVASAMIVIGFVILSLGLVALHTEQFLETLFTPGNLTAFQLRTLLPAVLLLPFLVGLLVIQGLSLYGPQTAVALTAIGSALIAALIVMVSNAYLRSAETKLREYLEQAEEARVAAENANKSRDEFVSFVGHELKAPLNSALTWADLMELEPSRQNVEDGIKVIKHSIATLVRLIEDLGEMARVTAGRFAIEVQRIDLVKVLRNACMESKPQLDEKDIALVADLPESPCIMRGDPVRIQQVFRNLLSNAGKYVHSGGLVKVHMSVGDRLATVTVQDDGPGLAADQCAKIFDPFYRAGRSNHGLGVGLAIARAIMEAHGGTIDVSSEGTGKGCKFSLCWKLVDD